MGDVTVHGRARHGHAAFSVSRRTPTISARPGTSLAPTVAGKDKTARHGRDNTRMSPTIMEPNEPLNAKFYQLGNGGSLIFEHDLNAVSDFLGRPHPEFHGIQVNDQERKKLRLQRAKKVATIACLRAQIASLEATVKAQEYQLKEMEEDDAGIDLRGGGAFLSDDDDFEEDEFTEEEDYAFLEPGPDDVVPIDVEDEGSCT
ncbi:hypothetical protein QYE76_002950 [Lolium multiflorum]|uniref:Uncharacterized protein n=1 Tax=Lolium multiflorum TaxID=4521 RepID=A0AAD8VYE4_LOLMU|nr:hypothetical protein QYE76_002950 [Lolium multiflorum]